MLKQTIAVLLLLAPTLTFAETSMDQLVKKYEQPGRPVQQDPQSQIRTLKSEIIDLKVERDTLQNQVTYLQNQIERRNATSPNTTCGQGTCIPADQVEREKILTHIVYSLSLYRLAEMVDRLTPANNVEAHKKAQKIMANAIEDLTMLGFDTKDPSKFPEMDMLVEQIGEDS